MGRHGAQLLPFLLGLGALHCDGSDFTSLQQPESGSARPPLGAQPPGDDPPSPPVVDDPVGNADPDGDGVDDGDEPDAVVYPHCEPRAAAGPYWLTEQDTVVVELGCASGAVLAGEAFQIANLPAHATYDAATRRITFTPGLDQAGVYELDLGIAGGSDEGHVQLQVADRFDAPGNVGVNPATYTLEYGVPVVHLTADSAINRDAYTPAVITYRGKAYPVAEAKYRGATSSKYPKRSFTLKFPKSDRFSDPLSIAGFTSKRRITLTTTFDDNSYLRARLAFELWNRVGSEHVQVQAYNVVLYLNGSFHGLYTLTDHVDGNLMEEYGLFEDGNLYKAKTHDANFRLTGSGGTAKATLSDGFVKKEGTPLEGEPGANADLEALVSWVATSSRESFLAEVGEHIVQREYEDWWMLVGIIHAGDSAGKNSYHYRDNRTGAPDARFHAVPWDFNESFGQNWKTIRRDALGDPTALSRYNEIFERLLTEPETREPLLARFHTVLQNEWEVGSVLDSYESWVDEIDAVARRDEVLWGAAYRDYFVPWRTDLIPYADEVDFVRQWIIDRWAFVSAFTAAPSTLQ